LRHVRAHFRAVDGLGTQIGACRGTNRPGQTGSAPQIFM